MTLAAIAGALTGNRMVGASTRPARAGDGAAPPGARAARAASPAPGRGGRVTAPVPPAGGPPPALAAFPHAQFLSNGNYTVVVTNAGGGELLPRARRHAVAAGRDPRPGGQYVYLRDVRSGAGLVRDAPADGRDAEDDVVADGEGDVPAEGRRDRDAARRRGLPEDDVEVRRLVVTNHGDRARELDVTSYAEIVLAPQADDLAHPAFGKLFVESEYVREVNALLCRRRPRSEDAEVFAVHVISQEGRTQGAGGVGERPRALPRPRARTGGSQALDGARSPATGVLIDPIVSLRRRAARARRRRATLVRHRDGVEPETALALAQRYRDPSATARTFALAFAHARSSCRHLGIRARRPSCSSALPRAALYADDRCGRRPRSSPGARWARRGSGHGGPGSPSCSCASSRT